MTTHPSSEIMPEVARLWSTMVVRDRGGVESAVTRIRNNALEYLAVQKRTGVPAAFIGVINERESSSSLKGGLGQGDPWTRVSTHVPKGHGPFKSWGDAAAFYLDYDGITRASGPWTVAYVGYKSEAWNGYGYRNHGILSPYCWGGTQHYVRGMYRADGVWDAQFADPRPGVMPVLKCLIEADFRFAQGLAGGASVAVPPGKAPPIAPVPAAAGGDKEFGTEWIQHLLNQLHETPDGVPLVEDGSFGRKTRAAVRMFQVLHVDDQNHPLDVNGLVGPATLEAMKRAAKELA